MTLLVNNIQNRSWASIENIACALYLKKSGFPLFFQCAVTLNTRKTIENQENAGKSVINFLLYSALTV